MTEREKSMTRTCSFSLLLAVLWAGTSASADPIKIEPIAVTASNTYSNGNSAPCNVADGNTSTGWNSGGFATQWIQFDLGRVTSVRKIRANVNQLPAGATVHTISVVRDPNNLTPVYTWNGYTQDGQWLEAVSDDFGGPYEGGGNIRYIRITTTSTPSWVAWHEIEVYGGLEYFGYYEDGTWGDAVMTGATVRAGANLVTIPADSRMTTELAAAKGRGVHAMIDISAPVFGSGTTLVDGWQTAWQGIRDAIVNGGYRDTVVAFYLMDEPYSIGRASGQTMQTLATWIKDKYTGFPDKATATVLAVEAGHVSTCRDMSPHDCLQPFEWVGFDCYGDWYACTSGYPGTANMDSLNAEFRSRLSRNQRMIAGAASDLTVVQFRRHRYGGPGAVDRAQ
jgi:hypothetical protein